MLISGSLLFVIILALVFNFINGMRDSSNIVATMISSRAFSPQSALSITAIAQFCGPFLFGVTVAKTIGSDIVASNLLSLNAISASLISAIIWNLMTWFFGIPSSSSHALIGGLLGAAFTSSGMDALNLSSLTRVLLALFTFPLISFIAGFLLLKFIYFLTQHATPNINKFFKRSQFVTAVALAMGHGTNDAQKPIGIITLSLIIAGVLTEFTVPFWVIFASALTMAIGASLGGWRLIRTLGGKFYKIRPVHSFATQLTSGIVILTASFWGLPISTSQVVSSAIVGVGASERIGKVRWTVAGDIITAWVITIPVSALFSAGIYSMFSFFGLRL